MQIEKELKRQFKHLRNLILISLQLAIVLRKKWLKDLKRNLARGSDGFILGHH